MANFEKDGRLGVVLGETPERRLVIDRRLAVVWLDSVRQFLATALGSSFIGLLASELGSAFARSRNAVRAVTNHSITPPSLDQSRKYCRQVVELRYSRCPFSFAYH